MKLRSFEIQIDLDSNGNLVGGVPGDDFEITGTITPPGGPTVTGTLLTGEVLAFGFAPYTGSTTEAYDFRFQVTGGLLASYFAGEDIGVSMLSPNSTFTGSFATNFSGKAEGNYGAIAPEATPTLATTPGGMVTVGGSTPLTDTATLAGGYDPSGTITFTLYDPSGAVVDTETAAVDNGDGTYSDPHRLRPHGRRDVPVGRQLRRRRQQPRCDQQPGRRAGDSLSWPARRSTRLRAGWSPSAAARR